MTNQVRPLSDAEFKSLGKEMTLLKREPLISYGDDAENVFSNIQLVDFDNKNINLELKYGIGDGGENIGKSFTEQIKLDRDDMEVVSRKKIDDSALEEGKPQTMMQLVEEIYESCKDNSEFIQDIKTQTVGDFSINYHHGLGTNIRNKCGFWSGNTPVYYELKALGVKHPDDMSGRVLVELYHYAKNKIENNNN